MRFNSTYFVSFCVLLVVEITIAYFLNDVIIRPFIGDVFVVMLIYCLASTFLASNSNDIKTNVFPIAIGVLVFACFIEMLQATNFLTYFRLNDNRLLRIMLGSVFDYWDFLAYALGFGGILLIENARRKR